MSTKKLLATFWKALDEIPEATTDRREWIGRLGDGWPVAEGYLTATGRIAKEIACASPGGDGCPRKIVKQADGRFRAVCGNKPAECDPVDLTREDVACLSLNRAKLITAVGAILKVESGSSTPSSSTIMLVGSHGVSAGISIPIILMILGPMVAPSAVMLTALAVDSGPIAVVVPTPQSISQDLKAAFSTEGHVVLSLADITTVKDHRLIGVRPAHELLGAIRDKILSTKVATTSRAWLLPADARWDELAFEFTVADIVHVRFRDETKRFEPEHFQMKHRGSGKPTQQWVLLRIFAACGGRLGWKNPGAKLSVKKQKQKLADKLRASFGIEADPIVWDRKAGVYQTTFVIRGDVLSDDRTDARG